MWKMLREVRDYFCGGRGKEEDHEDGGIELQCDFQQEMSSNTKVKVKLGSPWYSL